MRELVSINGKLTLRAAAHEFHHEIVHAGGIRDGAARGSPSL